MNSEWLKKMHYDLKWGRTITNEESRWLWDALVTLCHTGDRKGPNAKTLKGLGHVYSDTKTVEMPSK